MNLFVEAVLYWLQRVFRWPVRFLFGVVELSVWSSWRILRGLILLAVTAVASVGVVVATATWEVLRDLPEDSVSLMDGRERGSVTVLDSEGIVLGVRGQRFRRLTVDDAAPMLVQAILSNEDRRFYWHFGVDPIGVARAIWVNLQADRIEQGGSSITQQVAKLAFLSSDRKLSRKMRELPLALALEWSFSKDEILSIYLSRAYLGAGAFGFEAAARRYFGKSARDVNAAESALLSGLLRAPSRWSPTNDFAAAQDRARVVLGTMLEAGNIDSSEYATALVEVGELAPRDIDEMAPYFIDWVAEQVPQRIWRQAPDVILRTSLDRNAQATAERSIEVVLEEMGEKDKDAEAAMVVMTLDGAVQAMVGGRDYANSQFNRAVQASRQLGSAFKPFVYSAALEAGVSPNAMVNDAPITIGKWSPRNYSHRYRGWMPLATALAKSSNVAAVRLSQRAGVRNVVEMARRFGFNRDVPPYPSIALGVLGVSPLEVASAYSVFPNQGRVTPAYGIEEILSRDGDVLWRRSPPPARQVISLSNAEYMTGMLRQVVVGGTGRRAQLEDHEVAGKTGTTQEYRDAWFSGFSANLLATVWMGYDSNAKMNRVTGGRIPAQIWHDTMAPLHAGLPPRLLAQREVRHFNYEQGGEDAVSFRQWDGSGERLFDDLFRSDRSFERQQRRQRRNTTRRRQNGQNRSTAERWYNRQNR